MKLTALLMTVLCLAGTASAQETTFTMGSRPAQDRLVQHVRHSPQGTSLYFEQPAHFTNRQPQPLILGLAAVDLTPDKKNLLSYGPLLPHQAFVGMHPFGQPAPGGARPASGFNNQYGPLMPFYGGGVGVGLGDGDPVLVTW